jgi:superfamily I DNA/RNA helicase
VSGWIKARRAEGVAPDEIALIVRSAAELSRAREVGERAGLPHRILDDLVETVGGQASVCTMHLAKGLEFRAVAVMACDDEVIPLKDRIESVTDDSDLEEVYDTERLLYVACTAQIVVSGISPLGIPRRPDLEVSCAVIMTVAAIGLDATTPGSSRVWLSWQSAGVTC